jgi:hypothetical protein
VRYVVAALVGLSLTLSTTAHAQEVMQLGPVLVVTVVDAKPERAGAGQQVFMADRGGRKGQYVVVTSSATNSQAAGATSTVYNLLSPKTVPTLPQVDVLGMHYLKIRPERSEAFERFVAEKLHPTVGNLRPDLRVLYYKAVKGADAGNYVALFALTKVSRDKYWPGGSDSDDLRAAFSPPVKALTTELATYLVEGSYATDPKLAAAIYESREWTDFVLVPRGDSK